MCVNLVNQHGSEGELEKCFCDIVRSMNDPFVKYESFDFHKQCGADRWDRLQILVNRLANDQDTFGYENTLTITLNQPFYEYYLIFLNRYYWVTKSGNVINSQKGTFRINCIDCLDRTNVVQGLLAKRILHIQLIVSFNILK